MLSILIPTFNFNTYPLVVELTNQCNKIEGLIYEIIVNDDFSTKKFDNFKIKNLLNCSFYEQKRNQGLSTSRNFLIEQSKYDWCLFLDDDVWPTSKNFIKNYIVEIFKSNKSELFYGGLEYSKKKPPENELLRWIYGNTHEALPYKNRIKNKPKHFLCSNIVIAKNILKKHKFPNEIKTYGYEDLIFNLNIIQNNIKINQIDNPVFHKKLDDSSIFLSKTRKALDNLSKSIHLNLLPEEATGVSRIYKKYNKKWIIKLISFLFLINRKWMEKLLTSKYTNLNVFNFYRLGYFFSIHK